MYVSVPGPVVVSDEQHVLEDREEVVLRLRPGRHAPQHLEHLLGVGELESDVLEPVDHLLVVVLSVILKDVEVGGEIVELNLTKILNRERGERENEM